MEPIKNVDLRRFLINFIPYIFLYITISIGYDFGTSVALCIIKPNWKKYILVTNMTKHFEISSTTNRVTLSMPPSVSAPWIVDLLQKLGCIVIEGENPMFQNLQNKQQNSEFVSRQEGYIIRQSQAKHEVPIHTAVFCLVNHEVETDTGHSSPSILFYEDGDFFWIGKQNKLKPFKKINGLRFMHYLLQHSQEDICCTTLYHIGKTPVIPETNKVAVIDEHLNAKRKLYDFTLHKKGRIAIKKQIEELKIELEDKCFGNPMEKIEKVDQLKLLEAALKERTMHNCKPEEEMARTNIQKSIQRALNKIHKICPDLERYLNKSTVKTGYSCSYRPVLRDPVEWILFRE